MLDAIGEGGLHYNTELHGRKTLRPSTAAFDYQFGALTDAETPLSKAYFGLL